MSVNLYSLQKPSDTSKDQIKFIFCGKEYCFVVGLRKSSAYKGEFIHLIRWLLLKPPSNWCYKAFWNDWYAGKFSPLIEHWYTKLTGAYCNECMLSSIHPSWPIAATLAHIFHVSPKWSCLLIETDSLRCRTAGVTRVSTANSLPARGHYITQGLISFLLKPGWYGVSSTLCSRWNSKIQPLCNIRWAGSTTLL